MLIHSNILYGSWGHVSLLAGLRFSSPLKWSCHFLQYYRFSLPFQLTVSSSLSTNSSRMLGKQRSLVTASQLQNFVEKVKMMATFITAQAWIAVALCQGVLAISNNIVSDTSAPDAATTNKFQQPAAWLQLSPAFVCSQRDFLQISALETLHHLGK